MDSKIFTSTAGITTIPVLNVSELYFNGEKFQNLDQAEMDLIIANLDNITNNASAISAIQTKNTEQDTAITAIQTKNTEQDTAISNIQTSDTTQNTKLQYWNPTGTIYNNTGGNGGISGIFANIAVQIAGSDQSLMQIGGSSGISIEGGQNGLYMSSKNDVVIDTKDADKAIKIGLNSASNYGSAEIQIGGGGSTIRIGNKQENLSIVNASPQIFIGQKNNIKKNSETHMEGNFLLANARFTDLSSSSMITWEHIASLIPTAGIPAFALSFILTSSIPNFVYSDLWGLKSTLGQKLGDAETITSPKCKSLIIFNSEFLTVTEPALKVFTLRGTSSLSTLEGDNNLYTFLGKNVIRADGGGVISGRIDDGDFNSIITDTNYTQMNCSNGNLELVALGDANINFYAGSAVRNINKTATMSIKNDRRILMSYKSDEKTPSTDSRLTIKNGSNVLGTAQETNLLTLENESGSIISTLNANNISNQSLTLQTGYTGTTANTLYRDNTGDLFYNGVKLNNQTSNPSNNSLKLVSGYTGSITDTLYNDNGTLKFNGSSIGGNQTLAQVLVAGNQAFPGYGIDMNQQPITNINSLSPSANNDMTIGAKSANTGKTIIYTNATPRITVLNNGNVGIGSTTTPAYPLDVGGDINLTGNLRINNVVQSFGGSQTLAQVLTQGNTANTSINMNDNNITGLNKILGTSSGSLIIRDSSDIGGLRIGGGRIGVNSEPHTSYLIDCAGDINVQAGFNFRKGGALIGESQIRNIGGGYLEWATNQYSWTLNSSNFLPTGGINCQAQKVFLTINLWNDSNSDNGNDDSYYFQFNGYTANYYRYQSNMQLSFNGTNYVHNIASNYAFHVSKYAGNIITLKIEIEKLRPYYWGIVFRAFCGDVYIPGSTQFSSNWGDMMNNACFFYDGSDSNVFSSLRLYSNGSTQPFTNLNCAVHTLDRSTYYVTGGI